MKGSLINMISIEELENTHIQVPIIQVKADNYREGRDPKYLIDESTETFFSMPEEGNKVYCLFEGPKYITHIAIAFRKGDKRQYGFRISSTDFLSSKQSEDFEVFDVMDFTGKTMEIISQGYHEGELKGGSFSAYAIRAYTPMAIQQPKTQLKTQFESKVDIEGVSSEPIEIEKASSLEFDEGADKVLEKDSTSAFEVKGRGRVLRFAFKGNESYNLTAVEFVSNLPEDKQQLLRINSQDMQSLKKGETARYEFNPSATGSFVDVILNGSTLDESNSLGSIKFFGFPSKLLDEARDKQRLKDEQKEEDLKTQLSQDD